VIALGVGGILDSMNSQTAVLYDQPTHEALQQAVLAFQNRSTSFNEADLRSRAGCFSEANFLSNFEGTIESVLRRNAARYA
jgi:hypothetical protein